MRIHVENNNYHHLNNICIHCLQVNMCFENTETCSILKVMFIFKFP